MRIALLLLPWLELFTLIELGIQTSALTAMAYVIITIMLGLAILQRQGRGMFERLREGQDGRIVGPQLLIDDMSLGLAGLLLMFPGMITDVAAIMVMIGPLRRRLLRAVQGQQPEVFEPGRQTGEHETIEGDFRRLDDDSPG
jgi:UPF0716 protein FxsA